MLRLALFVLLTMFVIPAQAAEWVVDRVRGAAQLHSGAGWVDLAVGMVVDTGDRVRTGPNGRATLARGAETIELASGTELRLFDEGEQRSTTLLQSSGIVTVDVERRNVQHFSVQTPFMAAVVKGTRFSVAVGGRSASVSVERGEVQVQDPTHDLFADIRPGQTATVSTAAPMLVDGNVVTDSMSGTPVQGASSTDTTAGSNGSNAAVTPGSNAGGSGGNSASSSDTPPANSNAGGNGNGNGNAAANSNAGGNGNGNAGADNNAGGNGNAAASSNAGGNGNGNAGANSNAGGNGNGNAGTNSNSGGNGNGNAGANSNAGGNGNGNGNGNAGASSNAGGNGNGNGKDN